MKIDIGKVIDVGDLVYSELESKYGIIFRTYNCSGADYILVDLDSGDELTSCYSIESIVDEMELRLVAKNSQLILTTE